MKHSHSALSRAYEAVLRSQLDQGARIDGSLVEQASAEIQKSGLPILDFAKLHEQVLLGQLLPASPASQHAHLIRDAGNFFAAVIDAVSTGNEGSQDAARLRKTITSLSGRSVELASANRLLGHEIIERKKAETKLRKSEQDVTKSLEKSEQLKEELRRLSRQILSVQEEERKKISRELHEVVAQALLGINVRLTTLRAEEGLTQGLERTISQTQKMITKSATIVDQFARDLRPSALDDLGLIPALQSFMKNFTARTGVRTYLAIFPGVEELSAAKRTALFRVAEEAMTNVSRHAHATRVDVTIRKDIKCVHMEVTDDGKSFETQRYLIPGRTKTLGLLGMRERIEMVGGRFEIQSSPDTGTKITARIPVSKRTQKKWLDAASAIESAGTP